MTVNFELAILPKYDLTSVAKTKKSIPHERIELKCFNVAFNSLLWIIMSVPQLALQAVDSRRIRKMLSFCLGVLVYGKTSHQLFRLESADF